LRNIIYIAIIIILSCNNEQNGKKTEIKFSDQLSSTISENKETEQFQICWKGKLNSKTNILLHYQRQDDLIVGQIIYLDTKEQKPICIIGTIEEDRSLRLLEFDKTGNITGIIIGSQKETEFNGSWFSPKTKKEIKMSLSIIDTTIKIENIETSLENIIGEYNYQYSEKGFQGNLTIEKVNDKNVSIRILSVTRDPSRNIADIEIDTVQAMTDFIYKVPETDSCEFRVRFFRNFAYINYTRGYCSGIFGHNATVDGIFYKQK
jgi:hypothetical protein